MKLLREAVQDIQCIHEDVNGEKKLYMEGICLQGGIQNRNGRIYPMNILEREVKSYVKNYINEGRAVGELTHPQSPSINPDRISHKIIKLEQDGNNFIGKALIIEDHPVGKMAGSLLRAGVKLGASSRGVGTVKPNRKGLNEVQEDFRLLVGYDIVYDPSAPDAFQQAVMEDAEWVYEASTNSWKMAEQIKHNLQTQSISQINEEKLEVFQRFLETL